MSILKLVQVAEDKAEQLKARANEEIAALLENTKKETSDKVEALYNDYSLEQKKIDKDYTNIISKKKKEIINTYLENDEVDSKKSQKSVDKTVDFIIGKVIST